MHRFLKKKNVHTQKKQFNKTQPCTLNKLSQNQKKNNNRYLDALMQYNLGINILLELLRYTILRLISQLLNNYFLNKNYTIKLGRHARTPHEITFHSLIFVFTRQHCDGWSCRSFCLPSWIAKWPVRIFRFSHWTSVFPVKLAYSSTRL